MQVARRYELVLWSKWQCKKTTQSLFHTLVTNPKMLKIDMDNLPDKGIINLPTRFDDGKLFFQGQTYVLYQEGSLGWLSQKVEAIVEASDAVLCKPTYIYVSEKTVEWFSKMMKKRKHDQLTNLGSLLFYSGPGQKTENNVGQFYQLEVLSNQTLFLYALRPYARRAQRMLNYTTDVRCCFSGCKQQPHGMIRDIPFAGIVRDSIFQRYNITPSMEITRAGRDGATESYFSSSFFDGLLPQTLIRSYVFWRSSTGEFIGYPVGGEGDTELLIVLQKQVVASTPDGKIYRINVDDDDTGLTVKQKLHKLTKGRFSVESFECNTKSQLLDKRKISESGIYEMSARVTRRPATQNTTKFIATVHLLNSLNVSKSSSLGQLMNLLTKIEYMSDILIWTKTDARSDGEECEISLVELPRLRLSFASLDGVRLVSLDYDGFYLHTAVDEVFKAWVDDLPHALVLRNSNNESQILIPNYGLKRIGHASSLFPTKLVLDRSSSSYTNLLRKLILNFLFFC